MAAVSRASTTAGMSSTAPAAAQARAIPDREFTVADLASGPGAQLGVGVEQGFLGRGQDRLHFRTGPGFDLPQGAAGSFHGPPGDDVLLFLAQSEVVGDLIGDPGGLPAQDPGRAQRQQILSDSDFLGAGVATDSGSDGVCMARIWIFWCALDRRRSESTAWTARSPSRICRHTSSRTTMRISPSSCRSVSSEDQAPRQVRATAMGLIAAAAQQRQVHRLHGRVPRGRVVCRPTVRRPTG